MANVSEFPVCVRNTTKETPKTTLIRAISIETYKELLIRAQENQWHLVFFFFSHVLNMFAGYS